jgi:homoserine kinase type II
MTSAGTTPEEWRQRASAFPVPPAVHVEALGGTATEKAVLRTEAGAFVLRRRVAEHCRPQWIAFEHEWLGFLARSGFPVAAPLATTRGERCALRDGGVYEMIPLMQGRVVARPNDVRLRNLGAALARYHTLGESYIRRSAAASASKEGSVREDHPLILLPIIKQLRSANPDPSGRRMLGRLKTRLIDTFRLLESDVLPSLEKTIIHGDFHPGNVLFEGEEVSAFLDLAYADRGAVLRDVADASMSFCALHAGPYDPGQIESLAQPWRLEIDRFVAFLRGYTAVRAIADPSRALPPLMTSRWVQVLLRGCRKVAVARRMGFIFDSVWDQLDYIDGEYATAVGLAWEAFRDA